MERGRRLERLDGAIALGLADAEAGRGGAATTPPGRSASLRSYWIAAWPWPIPTWPTHWCRATSATGFAAASMGII